MASWPINLQKTPPWNDPFLSSDAIVWISIAILVCLFSVQRFGTDKVGHLFAPVITVWFLCYGCIGFYNLVKFDTSVVKAVNPGYTLYYFQRNGKEAWLSLGGIVLSIIGTEALFVDLSHFSVPSIRLSMCAVAYPALVLAYSDQAAFLREHTDAFSRVFYKSLPRLALILVMLGEEAMFFASPHQLEDTGSAVESVEGRILDNGSTFALYSLICRNANVGLIRNRQVEDEDVSNIQQEMPSNFRLRTASTLKSKLENNYVAKIFATLLGTSMVIGDGVLTRCISVLSAVEGIRKVASSITQDAIVWISVAILVGLFSVQRFGTDKVGHLFAPVITIWFLCNGSIGFYNLVKFDTSVVNALNPGYILEEWKGNFAIPCWDSSFHHCYRSFSVLGSGGFLWEHKDVVSRVFFKSLPSKHKHIYDCLYVLVKTASPFWKWARAG